MRVFCQQCQAVYEIDDSLVLPGGVKAQCPACNAIQVVQSHMPDSGSNQVKSALDTPVESQMQPAAEDSHSLELDTSSDPLSTSTRATQMHSGETDFPPLPDWDVQVDSRVNTQPDKQAEPSPPETRCARCGEIATGSLNQQGVCQRCLELGSNDRPVSRNRLWRVRKPNGVILGPLSLNEVKAKLINGEVKTSDVVAHGEHGFRLVTSYPELSSTVRRPGERLQQGLYRSGSKLNVTRWAVFALAALVVVFVLYAVLTVFLNSETDQDHSVVEDLLDAFAEEIPNPVGTSLDAYRRGRELMLRDERLAYLEADRQFKTALLLNPNHVDAYAGWVQNRALLDAKSASVSQRKSALDLVDYALEMNPGNLQLLRAKAYLLFSLNHLAESRALAQKVLQTLEDDPETLLILGATYLDSSTDSAVSYLQRALTSLPSLNLGYRLMGEAKIRLGQFHQALQFFEKRLEKDPAHVASLSAKARIYSIVGKFELARSTYETILAAEPHNLEAGLILARILYQMLGDREQAGLILQGLLNNQALSLSPVDRAQLLVEYSVVLRQMGDLEQARQKVDQALELNPASLEAQYAQAWVFLRSNEIGSAIDRFRALLSYLPDMPRIALHLAEADALIPSYSTAIKKFQRALERLDSDFDAHLMIASLFLELDQVNQAYSWLRRATEVDPFHHLQHRVVTSYYEGLEVLLPAVERVASAVKKYTEDPLALALAGAIFWRLGQIEKGKDYLMRSLRLDSECFAANLYLGALALSQNQFKQAIPYLQEAQKSQDRHLVTRILLASAFMNNGQVRQAERLIRSSLRNNPADMRLRTCLAEIYMMRNKRKSALKILRKLYQGDDHNVRVNEMLFELGQ